jgi:cell division protein FtsI (penicillin-binding protein 3)
MGQEIGVSPIQLISMVSTIANDGIFVPPRIIAGITPPRSTPQLTEFHPSAGRRVISTMTAAEMKRMLEGVVLRGTGVKAILDGYSSAGKTGTAQKTDPVTGRYSKSHYIASFTGFAPVNNPAVSALVILDSPRGAHEGGSAAAPVFSRLTQQVLGYLNISRDIELQNDERRRLLRARANNADLGEAAPDYIAQEDPDVLAATPEPRPEQPEQAITNAPPGPASPTKSAASPEVVSSPGEIHAIASKAAAPSPSVMVASAGPPSGTVVLDTGGRVVVPDFHGKALRSALEEAQSAGIELEVSGSGVGREQSPAPGAKIPAGGKVSVRFGR